MHPDKVHLLYLSNEQTQPSWALGNVTVVQRSVKHILAAFQSLLSGNALPEWLLLWDASLNLPDIEQVKQLCDQPVDVWHAGVKLGLADFPDVINYIDPAWMYNKSASQGIEHSSFRMSFKASLVRTSALKKIQLPSAAYTSVDMLGLALGYRLLKQGAILRYTPVLIEESVSSSPRISRFDEWVFAREFFSGKWQIWTMVNKPGFFANLIAWLKTGGVKTRKFKPVMYSSQENTLKPAYETVSVLAPTLNRYSYLAAELEQLSEQTILPCEVLITDQTDIKDRQQIDVDKYPKLTVRCFPQEEKGQCLAWNKLLMESKGDYVLFLGDDADDIKPGFIEKLLASLKRFNCDMVASHVIEVGIPKKEINHHYFMTDTFPITLIKRSVVEQAGFMDMFFNKNIRADHDLAMRCHLNGALMIFDSSALILHHRAPSGGLRTHNARVVTNHMTKTSISKFTVPTSSEIYLVKKYYNDVQFKNFIRIKYFNQLMMNGNTFKRALKTLVFLYKLPTIRKSYKINLAAAEAALKANNTLPVNESIAGNR